MTILDVKDLKKTYTGRFGGNQVQALKGVTFSVEEGEYVAIMGESGSGKTTLLNILAALDKATAGSVMLDQKNLAEIKDKELASFRRENLGFVFQEFNLLDTFTLKDNLLSTYVGTDGTPVGINGGGYTWNIIPTTPKVNGLTLTPSGTTLNVTYDAQTREDPNTLNTGE